MRETTAHICALLERIANGIDRMNSGASQPIGKPLSLAAAAKLLGCSAEHLRRQVRAGAIKATRIGSVVRIPAAEVARLAGGN
jgi:excisionase family DNA binding protein